MHFLFSILNNIKDLKEGSKLSEIMFHMLKSLRPCETQISIFFKSTFKRLFGKRRTSSAPYMLILYSVFFNDSIGIFMKYPCLKIMSVFHITLKNWWNSSSLKMTLKFFFLIKDFLRIFRHCWTHEILMQHINKNIHPW